TFSYTIYFSFPAGTQYARITDQIPSALNFHSIAVTNACGTPSVNAPTPGTNGTVTAVWSSVPSTGCSGSMTIVVSFPNGVTCNGTQVRNLVCIDAVYLGAEGNVKVNFCTPAVMTTARAINPWKIQKQVQQGSWQDGNCNWRVNNDTVTYKICVYKNNSYTCGSNGQLNLVNGVVTDILPTGAQFISATQPISISGNTITWNVGNLDATATYNTVCCDIKVYYPQSSFPNGTQITNTAILSGQLGNANSPCPQSQFSYSYSVCCEIHRCSGTTFDFFKGGWTNGQPGCAGSYYIQFHNTGTTSLSANTVVISDELPPVLNLVSATSYGGNITITTSGNTFTGTLNTTLPADGWIYITINFTISSSAVPNSTVTNCAYVNVQGLPLDSACWTFVINSPKPRPCLWKEICSPQGSYNIGQTIRMRMRIQNIGGQSISGAIITDNLNENFEYIGNPIYYVSTAWNTPCNPTIGSGNVTTWSPSPNLTVSGQSISITNVNIPSSCQNIFWDGCGMYGNGSVPYHWIEFDVKIKDTAGLGNIPNSFTISGGNLTEPTNSNTVYVLTTGTIGFNLIKEVAPSDTSSWSSNIILSPGENFYYKLRMQVAPASIPLRKVTFVDLLPKDAITIDNKILASPCMARGSLFDITYQSDIFTNPFANLYRNPSINQASANGIAPIILFPSSCGIETGWVGTPPLIGDKNIGIFFLTAIGAGSNGEVKFKAKVSSAGTTNQTSCNSFAAGGSVLHYLNSTTSEEIAVTPLESDKVCVNINETNNCYAIKPSQFNLVDSSENGCVYKIQISFSNITGSDIAGCAFSPQGTVEPSNFNVPIGSSMLTFTFTDTPPQDDYVCIYFGIREATGNCMVCDSACDELPPCSSSMDCCPKWDKIGVQCAYKDEESNQVYSINATIAIPSRDCLPLTLIINSPDGTFSPSVFTINSLTYTINTEFTDTPPSNINTNITIEFTFYSNNQIVCKESYKLLIPNCEEPINDCCKGLNQNVITTASRLKNGIILITGTAFPNTPIKRFSATIVSAQRKLMGPIIGSWERIYGDFTDFTSCVITNPPGPLQILTPFSREMVWEGNCLDGSPGVLKLYATFPQPSSSMSLARSDSLKFTIRYSFTTCDCKTCDTLITYTLYRSSPIIIDLFNTATILPLSKNTIQLDIPQIYSEPDDNIKISIMALEIYSLAKNNVIKSGKIIGPRENKDLISTTSKGGIVVLLDTKTDEIPLQIQLEGGVSKGIIVHYHYCIQDGEDEDCTGIEERVYPLNLDVGDANATIVKQEGIVDNIRTFSLAILNEGKTTLSGVRLQLSPLPQDDGTIPSILAIGSPTSPELIIKKYQNAQSGLEPQSNTEYEFSEDIVEPNNAIKPIYITVSGIAKQFGTEKVSFNYTLIDGNSQEVGAGTIVVEGAISGIIQMPGDEGAIPSLKPHISAIIPNPAMETATVSIWSPFEVSDAIIELYDIQGGLVKTIVLPILPKGNSAITIDLADYSSGAYMVILKTHKGTSTKNMVIIK
ncbi:MAG TPA: T9SS type A sorting domain-containing protein, partial [Candidatus Kapabacteria bacterium]|nr:T9SS type A sorting domain-containing protein [Candidatus Kapabacteria bacterium]